MTNGERAELFVAALGRQIARKSWMRDGIETPCGDPFRILADIAEETGEAATELNRERYYGAIAECVDVAHAALRLAIALDHDGSVLSRLFTQNPD